MKGYMYIIIIVDTLKKKFTNLSKELPSTL